LAIVLTAGACRADPSSKPWEVTIGAAHPNRFVVEEGDYRSGKKGKFLVTRLPAQN